MSEAHTPPPPRDVALVLRVLVVDDEQPARDKVVRLLHGDTRFAVVGEARDGYEALDQVERLLPDLVVLDIQMPGLNGFEFLAALGDTTTLSVVFSTASDAHALRAFDAHAVDYLLKPYDAARFARALDKVYAQRLGATPDSPRYHALLQDALSGERSRIALKTVEGPWVRVACDDIVRISAAGKYACIVMRDASHTVRKPLRELLATLDDRFVRVHRSDVVNVQAVDRLESWDHGDALLVLRDGTSVVMTRTFRKDFVARFRAQST